MRMKHLLLCVAVLFSEKLTSSRSAAQSVAEECFRAGDTYRGTVAVTERGDTCEMWSSKVPHNAYPPEDWPDSDLDQNYCRVLDEAKPWCFEAGNGGNWGFCNIPSCPEAPATEAPATEAPAPVAEECFRAGDTYRGTVAVTEKGDTCEMWSSEVPYSLYPPEDWPDSDLDQNYCRVLDEDKPWCYVAGTGDYDGDTVDYDSGWEFCNIPSCPEAPATEAPAPVAEECFRAGDTYRGTVAVTEKGDTCEMWSSGVPYHSYPPEDWPDSDLDQNYCRVLDEDKPWCFVAGGDFGFCNIPSCPEAPATEAPAPDPCAEVTCRVKEDCVVEEGRGVCVAQSKAFCWAFGDPQYSTFDGRTFTFGGTDNYTMVKTTGLDTTLTQFSIQTKNELQGNSPASSLSLATLDLLGHRIAIQSGQKGIVEVDGANIQLVQTVTLEFGMINITQSGLRATIQSTVGLKVTFDWSTLLIVSVTSSYYGNLQGLCGNYNGNADDDFTTRNGVSTTNVTLWAGSWSADH